jgi:hypothetical protein
MDRKQKEALIIALAEKGETYREITKKAGVSPNTIKAVLNKAGLDQNTSISSRAFELYVKQRNPLQVAIELDLKAEDAIRYYREYFILLGITEFTRVYIQVKDNPWPFINLVKLAQNSGISDNEVLTLLNIANGYLPRIRLEYDRLQQQKNSMKAELQNTVRTYQDFCDRNLRLYRREHELQHSISELEAKKFELQKVITELQDHASSLLRERNTNSNILDLEVKQMEEVISMNDVLIPSPDMANNYQQNENEMIHYHLQVEPSLPRALIFDTKDLT